MKLKASILLAAGCLMAAGPSLQAQRAHSGVAATAPSRAVAASSVPARSVARPPTPNLGGRPFVYRGPGAAPLGLGAPAASYTGIAQGALRSNENRRRFNNFGPGYGGFYGVPYVPYLDSGGVYSSFSGYPSYSEQAEGIGAQAAQSEAQMQQDAMAQQLDQMNAEIGHLRENQMQLGPGPYAPSSQWTPPPAPAPVEQQAPQAPITLVLQSGAKISVANYAVMNGVIWDFSKQPAHKIPVSTINVAASEKATDATGGEFPQLNSSH